MFLMVALYFLPVLRELLPGTLEWKRLLLRPTGKIKGQFERCGLLEVKTIKDHHPWLVVQGHLGNEEPSSEISAKREYSFECESFDGTNYTISIV
jgi:hypothetical protein